MGSVFCSTVVQGHTLEEAKKAAAEFQERMCFEYGNDSYQGHLGCVPGVDPVSKRFRDMAEAEAFISESHDKWDPPMLVRFGPNSWLLAGWMPE